MIKHEKSIRYKFLACLLAVTLVFGLSALPAFAVPDDASEGDLAAQTEEASNAAPEKPTTSQPAVNQEPASGSKQKPLEKDEDAVKNDAAKSTDVLSPGEKLGAVLEGEGERALENATGDAISAASDDSEAEDEELDEKGKARQALKKSIISTASYDSSYSDIPLDYDCSLTIKKQMTADSTIYTTENKEGEINQDAAYTAVYKIRGEQLDDKGRAVYLDNEGYLYYVANTNDGLEVQDKAGNALYTNDSGTIFFKDSEGSFFDSNMNSTSEKLYSVEGKIYRLTDEEYNGYPSYIFVDQEEGNLYCHSDTYGWAVIKVQDNAAYIQDENGVNLKDDEGNDITFNLELVTLNKFVLDSSTMHPKVVFSSQVGVNVGTDVAGRTIDNLPFPARYIVEELSYGECGYTCVKVSCTYPNVSTISGNVITINLFDDNNKKPEVTFTNKSTGTDTPNSGVVNGYVYDKNNGSLSMDEISKWQEDLESK